MMTALISDSVLFLGRWRVDPEDVVGVEDALYDGNDVLMPWKLIKSKTVLTNEL